VIALISKSSLTSSGEKWEISCAKEEKKKVLAIWAYTDDKTNLPGTLMIRLLRPFFPKHHAAKWPGDMIKRMVTKPSGQKRLSRARFFPINFVS
jgi:hypothetical protein